MEQRVRLANLVAFYRANRPWMDGLAFSTRPQKWSDYNAFVSANFASNLVALTKSEAAAGTCIVAPYRISEGNLPSVSVDRLTGGNYKTNLFIGELTLDNASVAAVTQALLANNNGLFEGMQLSLIVNYQQQVGGVYRAVVRYYEVILSLTDERVFTTLMSDEHLTAVERALGFTAGESDPVMGFAFILSADEGGKTRTSTQYLTLTSTTLYDTYTTATALTNAIASYGGEQLGAFLSSGYQTSSNSGVALPYSILTAALPDQQPVSVGGQLGMFGGETDQIITLTLNAAPDATPASVAVVTTSDNTFTTTKTTTNVAMNGQTITATFENGSVNPNDAIIQIKCTLVGGLVITADFASSIIDG